MATERGCIVIIVIIIDERVTYDVRISVHGHIVGSGHAQYDNRVGCVCVSGCICISYMMWEIELNKFMEIIYMEIDFCQRLNYCRSAVVATRIIRHECFSIQQPHRWENVRDTSIHRKFACCIILPYTFTRWPDIWAVRHRTSTCRRVIIEWCACVCLC